MLLSISIPGRLLFAFSAKSGFSTSIIAGSKDQAICSFVYFVCAVILL